MWGKLSHHLHNAIKKGKEHVKHISDFGQRAWDTIGRVVKKTTHAVNSVNAEASNFTGMHPMVDGGIEFLNQVTSGVNHIFDWYTKTDEKKNTIEQSFKDKNPDTMMVPMNGGRGGIVNSGNGGQLTRRSSAS